MTRGRWIPLIRLSSDICSFKGSFEFSTAAPAWGQAGLAHTAQSTMAAQSPMSQSHNCLQRDKGLQSTCFRESREDICQSRVRATGEKQKQGAEANGASAGLSCLILFKRTVHNFIVQ